MLALPSMAQDDGHPDPQGEPIHNQPVADYYLNNLNNKGEYYAFTLDPTLTWGGVTGVYVAHINVLHGDFKIYSGSYKEGQSSGQNNLIFGAANGFGGVSVQQVKQLEHPGTNLSVEGGGQIKNAVVYFNPSTMQMYVEQGEDIPADLTVTITDAQGISPGHGTLTYEITPGKNITNPGTLTYNVELKYVNASGQTIYVDRTLSAGTTSDTVTFDDLKIGAATQVNIHVKTDYNGSSLEAETAGEITTPEVPILIGQIAEGSWQPNVGIVGTAYPWDRAGVIYYFQVEFTGNGEFSFVTKLGTTSTDWATVNANPRYSPSSRRVDAPLDTWLPYQQFNGSTENAWQLEELDTTDPNYIVAFDYATKQIKVLHGSVVTGVKDIETGDESAQIVDVYNLSGTVVRSGVQMSSATDGLPAGFYIAGGKKLLVR